MFKKSVSARRAGAAVTCALLTVLGGGGALANGRSPASVSVHPRQGSATDLAIWTTWGLLVRRDSGGFQWMCENAVKVGGAFDPTLAFRADGAIVTTSFEGLLINRDRCVFEATPLGVKFVSTLALSPDGALYAAVSDINDSKIYRSGDGGGTFGAGVDAGLTKDYWLSVAVAPSALPAPAPAGTYRVYLSGFRLDPGQDAAAVPQRRQRRLVPRVDHPPARHGARLRPRDRRNIAD
ncbi:MAG: hypothetical protein HC863_01075 [Myxococcales bacterium]|nr:hypothetical protein [Myxococcales bacterium]